MIGGDKESGIVLSRLLDNLKECMKDNLREGNLVKDFVFDAPDGTHYVCSFKKCSAKRPHIHIRATGAGWPTGSDNIILSAGNIDATMKTLEAWKKNGVAEVATELSSPFKDDGWVKTIQCVIQKSKTQAGYEYPLTPEEFPKHSEIVDDAISKFGALPGINLNEHAAGELYKRIKNKSYFPQTVGLALRLCGAGKTGKTIELSYTSTSIDEFTTALSGLLGAIAIVSQRVAAYCKLDSLSQARKNAVVLKLSQKIGSIVASELNIFDNPNAKNNPTQASVEKLINDAYEVRDVEICPPDASVDASAAAAGKGGRRRTFRRKNGRRRTQKKRKTYV